MNRARFSRISHSGIRFWNPLDEKELLRVVDELPLMGGERLLDYGCGDGELLVEIAKRHNVQITGIDINQRAIDLCQNRIDGTFMCEPFRTDLFEQRSFDLVINIGASPGFEELVSQIGPLVRIGGRVLIGDGFWQRPPAKEYLNFLGAQESDMSTHDDNIARLISSDFEIEDTVVSSLAAWDRYEDKYNENMVAYLREHPNDPEYGAFEARRSKWRSMYLEYGRGTMGFALYQAVKFSA